MAIFKQLNICNLYIFIWVLYMFHWQDVGAAFPLLESLSNVFLGFNLLISIYYSFVFWSKYKQNEIFKCINILILSFVIYGIFSIVERDYVGIEGTHINSGTYLIGALRTFLPIYTCFMFTKLGYITEKTIRFWSIVFFVQCIYVYFLNRFVYLGLETSDFGDLRTNNTSYLFVSIFPLVYFYRKHPILQYFFIAILLFLTIAGIKRGAILIVTLATVYFFMHTLQKSSVKIKLLTVVTLLIMVFQGAIIVSNLYENSDTFQHRVESTLEGNVSHRDQIARNLLEIYSNSDIRHLLFGFGADGTLGYGNYAHNDWLEILFDQGIWGLTVFTCFWFVFLKHWRNQIVEKNDFAFFLGLWIICNLTRTFFSMWYSMANIMVTLPLGYYMATLDSRKRTLLK